MCSSRWTTTTLLGVTTCVGLLAFYGGRFSASRELLNGDLKTELRAPANSAATTTTSGAMQLSTPSEPWEKQWVRLAAQPSAPSRNRELAVAIESWATREPARALALAMKETHRQAREERVRAALRGWASVDAQAAGEWVLAQTTVDREQAISAVLAGAVQNPADALRVTERLAAGNPALVRDYGERLIFAFGEAGKFDLAVEYAARSAVAYRVEWMTAAFSRWGAYQPDEAAMGALALAEESARQPALQAALSGWAQADPEGLAEFTLALPIGPERSQALRAALCNWANGNPTAAAGWMERFMPDRELDAGAAAVATSAQALSQPEVAMGWVRRIVDTELRSGTMAAVLRDLASRDPVAARRYTENSTDLNVNDRASVLATLAQPLL